MGADIKNLSREIVELVGGTENIISVTHCMTRLRFILNDKNQADTEKIKNLKEVKGAVFSTGQYQVCLLYTSIKNFSLSDKSKQMCMSGIFGQL